MGLGWDKERRAGWASIAAGRPQWLKEAALPDGPHDSKDEHTAVCGNRASDDELRPRWPRQTQVGPEGAPAAITAMLWTEYELARQKEPGYTIDDVRNTIADGKCETGGDIGEGKAGHANRAENAVPSDLNCY